MTNDTSQYEHIRAWVEGTLDPNQVKAFTEALAADDELADAAAAYRIAHAASMDSDDPTALPALEFDDMWRACRRTTIRRGALQCAAAAAVVLLGILGFRMLASDAPTSNRETLVLHSIPVSETHAPAFPIAEALPVRLETYVSVQDGAIQWIEDLNTARVIALATGRPLFLHEYLSDCPLCGHMAGDALADPAVLKLMEGVVPVRLDQEHAPDHVLKRYNAQAWPYYEVRMPDKATGAALAGLKRAPAFRTALAQALTGRTGNPVAWRTVQQLAKRYRKARDAVSDDDLGTAYTHFGALAGVEAGGEIARLGRQGLTALRATAQHALHAAQAADDPIAAVTEAVARFTGTPMADDFRAILKALNKTHTFPLLQEEK